MIEQVPAETSVRAVSEIEQIALLAEEKETARAEDEVAVSAKGPVPRVRGIRGSKVIDWLAFVKVKGAVVLVADS